MKTFKKASYSQLNNKQKENHNFHKLASLLASYGFNCIWLNDDVHKIQLKSRLTFDKKYMKKDLYIAHPKNDGFSIYPHDEALKLFIKRFKKTKSWNEKGIYHNTTQYKEMDKYFVNKDSTKITF